jgi:hypothetical protein
MKINHLELVYGGGSPLGKSVPVLFHLPQQLKLPLRW